eukprot:m51a1_g14703 hypothetical protein (85) ;mRNA; r:129407-131180
MTMTTNSSKGGGARATAGVLILLALMARIAASQDAEQRGARDNFGRLVGELPMDEAMMDGIIAALQTTPLLNVFADDLEKHAKL